MTVGIAKSRIINRSGWQGLPQRRNIATGVGSEDTTLASKHKKAHDLFDGHRVDCPTRREGNPTPKLGLT